MKVVKYLILIAFIGYIIAVGYNILSINNWDEEGKIEQNSVSIGLEVVKRLNPGFLGIIGGVASGDVISAFGGEERMAREYSNVICDWYAPIKWSPVLSLSKEIWWLIYKSK
jgi:hypothetical protein